jgi:threonine dehydrogenase-like Zn-dependent dehydrogenase
MALGADAVFETAAEATEAAGDGADVVIEAIGGDMGTLALTVEMVRPGGTIVVLGDFAGNAELPGLAFSRKEARLVASNCSGCSGGHRDFELAIGLLHRHLEGPPPAVRLRRRAPYRGARAQGAPVGAGGR